MHGYYTFIQFGIYLGRIKKKNICILSTSTSSFYILYKYLLLDWSLAVQSFYAYWKRFLGLFNLSSKYTHKKKHKNTRKEKKNG